MNANQKLYMAAWLYSWHLNELEGKIAPVIRKKAIKAFPYKSDDVFQYQHYARLIYSALKDNSPNDASK